jgi:PAT family beta-lactamase induction signal transducer AmpG
MSNQVSVWKAFTQPSAWTLFFFGFSSGLPYLLVGDTLALWLKDRNIELKEITLIAGVGMLYTLKFIWAPLLDHWKLPGFSRLGRRRGWLLFAQSGVVLALLAMAAFTPGSLQAFIWATVVVAFFGAMQDIAVDAYRIEIAPESAQGALVATYTLGYRLGLIVAGAFAAIMADHVVWPLVYSAMAACMLIPMAANLLAREPDRLPVQRQGWAQLMQAAVIEPFVDFFRRYKWPLALLLLVFILLFKVPEQATMGGIMGPFYRDMGFAKTQIGSITKLYGIWAGIVGVFVGGAMVARWGAWKTLGLMIVVCGACNLLYLLLLNHHGNVWVLAAVISAANFTLGMLAPPTVAFLSGLVNRQHTATQYALFSSLVNLPGKLLGLFAGGIVTSTGYGMYFVITVLALLPAVLLYAVLTHRLRAHVAAQAG